MEVVMELSTESEVSTREGQAVEYGLTNRAIEGRRIRESVGC